MVIKGSMTSGADRGRNDSLGETDLVHLGD
jgi:hypothetical protein